MSSRQTAQLYDFSQSVAFYEARYALGYMDEWPQDKIDQVLEVLGTLGLPRSGKALDFGCGTGVFSAILAQALPEWEVFGVDVSRAAIDKARQKVSGVKFFQMGDSAYAELSTDFLFSHHVLEHVADLSITRDQMLRYLGPRAHMLHILPCGNSGSFAHTLCQLRDGGIESSLGNRFFFEDEGHVRRLTTDELVSLFTQARFLLLSAHYTGQYWSAIDYFTRIEPYLIDGMSDPSKTRDESAARQLRSIRRRLKVVAWARNFVIRYTKAWSPKRPRSLRSIARVTILALPYFVARAVGIYVSTKARNEWSEHKYDPRGDQMFVAFYRDAQ